ncbi:VanZ family protein [Turicibacter sanguinis]|uniref:VanZ family protein n=1 Tax=Turicibacter sanguinis TaxID=154288 RepID=UPI0018AB6383|nr:VanZ family protein [Turicibacter sanguinis]MCU7201159.1 VanZ family protein [Turicibacter sanguinis]
MKRDKLKKLLLVFVGIILVFSVMRLIFNLSAQSGSQSGSLSNSLYLFLRRFEFLGQLLHYWDQLVIKVLYMLNLEELYPLLFSTYSNWNVIIRKWAHFGIYMSLGIASMGVFTYAFNFYKAFIITLYVGAFFAFTDEVHQLFVDGRSGQISDFGIDVLGLVTGITFCLGIYMMVCLIKRIKKVIHGYKQKSIQENNNDFEEDPFTLDEIEAF